MSKKINIPKEFLITEHIHKNKSIRLIAKETGYGLTTIKRYLKKYNIHRKIQKKIIHYCKDCLKKGFKKELSRNEAIRCRICENKYRRKPRKIYYCKEPKCNNKINYKNWKHGKKRCRSCSKKGPLNNMFGKKRPDTIKRMKNKTYEEIFGIKKAKQIKQQISKTRKERKCGYINGKGYEPYSPEFTRKLKETIRKRDNYKCQGKDCSITQEEHFLIYGRDIEIHHIDYDKTNCKETNLLTLCKKCHSRTNGNRTYWTNYFKTKINQIAKKRG